MPGMEYLAHTVAIRFRAPLAMTRFRIRSSFLAVSYSHWRFMLLARFFSCGTPHFVVLGSERLWQPPWICRWLVWFLHTFFLSWSLRGVPRKDVARPCSWECCKRSSRRSWHSQIYFGAAGPKNCCRSIPKKVDQRKRCVCASTLDAPYSPGDPPGIVDYFESFGGGPKNRVPAGRVFKPPLYKRQQIRCHVVFLLYCEIQNAI